MKTEPHPKAKILIAGAGGFIGGHLVAHLRKQGIKDIRAVDLKPFSEWYQKFDDVDNHQLDLRELEACRKAAKGM
ncbi:NAD-dependent epimerase/dehydratase family protein, partial [bacterium]|nr:NAD-dependent epimerase/dehydratase family protein [bacterium]